MENWDVIIGVLMVLVFVLLVQRVASPFRCESGEEEKDGNCVSNSTKERWWAFWEEPKCKRGELQADYTCLASMIWDAVSPGQAPPPAPTPTATQNFDSLQYFNRLVGLVERNFLNMSTGPSQEFSINIGVANACPIQPGAKVNVNVTVKQAFDMSAVKDFQNVVTEFYNGLNGQDGHGTPDEKAARRNATNTVIQKFVTTENLMPLVTRTLDYQSHKINIAVCNGDSPLRLDEHFVAAVIVNNILMKIGQGISGLIDENAGVKTSCPTTAAVMTLGSDGKPNGILTGPGQTITRGTDDTYVPGKVRMYAPIAIDGVGKQAGTAFHTQLLETPCEGTDLAIGDWAKFDVQKPT